MKQYQQIQPGLRRHISSGKYQAYKRVSYKQYSKTFRLKKDALHWLKYKWDFKEEVPAMEKSLKFYYERYLNEHVIHLELSSQEHISKRLFKFIESILDKKLYEINRICILNLIESKKLVAADRRLSFKSELKLLKSFFNWINLRVEKFIVPITRDHYRLSVIKKRKGVRSNKISSEKMKLFLSNLTDIYQDLAYFQFYTAGRIGEAVAVQVENVDFINGTCLIQHSIIWSRGKVFLGLKNYPKNGEARLCHLPGFVLERLKARIGKRTSGYVFKINNEPLKYRSIQHYYGKALKLARIENVSVTHFLRHSAANIVREASNSLDFAQAMTGHKDRSVVEKTYTQASSSTQKKALEYLVSSMSV